MFVLVLVASATSEVARSETAERHYNDGPETRTKVSTVLTPSTCLAASVANAICPLSATEPDSVTLPSRTLTRMRAGFNPRVRASAVATRWASFLSAAFDALPDDMADALDTAVADAASAELGEDWA
jgi:hypothetical protein